MDHQWRKKIHHQWQCGRICGDRCCNTKGQRLQRDQLGGLAVSGSIPAGAPASVTIHDCDIEDNTDFGLDIENDVPIIVNAENTWWGSSTGPTHTDNPGGTGDEIVVADPANTTVMFAPFSVHRIHGDEACTEWIFIDGFESADTTAWSSSQ